MWLGCWLVDWSSSFCLCQGPFQFGLGLIIIRSPSDQVFCFFYVFMHVGVRQVFHLSVSDQVHLWATHWISSKSQRGRSSSSDPGLILAYWRFYLPLKCQLNYSSSWVTGLTNPLRSTTGWKETACTERAWDNTNLLRFTLIQCISSWSPLSGY